MTIQGAMKELVNLLNADDIPIYYKGGIKKVIETIDDYIDGKDDYIKRKDEPQNGYQTFSGTSVYVSRFEDEPQTDNGIGCSRCVGRFDCYDRDMPHAVRCNNYGKITDEPQTDCVKVGKWYSFTDYVVEMQGDGKPKEFRIVPQTKRSE